MEELKNKCPKCNDRMVQGFIPDHLGGGALVGNWIEGPPKKSFWTGTKAPMDGGIPIAAFRCANCGFLEFYARDEFAAS